MRKIYITKEDLINELETISSKIGNKTEKNIGVFAYLVAFIAIVGTLFLLIPIVVLWLLLLVIYIPGFFLDSLILKIFAKRKQ